MRKLQLDWQGYYPFDERSIRGKVQDDSGIYKISREQKDGALKPVFVGQAKSIRLRLLEKLTTDGDTCLKEQAGKGGCMFRFAYLYTQEEMDAAERALYKRYVPKCNDPASVPEAEDVEVNTN
jgi:hypothetical protein